MKYSKNIGLSLCLLLCSFLMNGQIISVIENDRGDKREVALNEKQIIDINSSLEVTVSKTTLLESIKSQFPQFSEQIELDEKIVVIRQALRNQKNILTILQQEVASPNEQATFFTMMTAVLDQVQADPFLSERYEALNETFFTQNIMAQGESLESYVFKNLNSEVIELQEALKTLEVDNYLVSLVAFKKDKLGGDRVHVKNFDTYNDRDYVTIERWVTSLSETQKQQLTELAKIAKENNELAVNVFQEVKALVLKQFPSITCVSSLKEGMMSAIKNTQISAQISDSGKAEVAQLIALLKRLENLATVLKTDISLWNISTPFTIGNQLQSILKDLQTVQLDVNGLMSQIFNATATTARAEIQPLIDLFNTCFTDLKADFEKIKNGITLLLNKQENYLANKVIGDEVIAFSLDNLPDKGFVNLKGTGQRANGDALLLEMILRIPSKTKGVPEQFITLEQREFVMQLIGARSEVAVGLILANPFNKGDLNLESDRNFFYAPNASLLLKFGSKKSYFYNEFLDFGIGLNFAAPDFNTDGTPEFGTGIITTAFKDVISLGLNYNVTLDNFYWFFGINLPFNLPGLPVNTIKP